nr:MBL fold metallo-hydrolase [Pedobacter sp. SYSU D00535]
MSLFVASLNSGSNGNCYYVGNEKEAVLIDAGISCREIEKRMKRLGLDLKKVKAVFISHEHSDHIKGLTTLSRKYALPVYITSNTYRNSGLQLESSVVAGFKAHLAISVGSLSVLAFPKFHDASDPHSFIVTCSGVKIGVFTDIGTVCEQVRLHFQQCDAVFLEANYCSKLLSEGSYPYFLKRRITGGNGHLSNDQALELFLQYRTPRLTHLFLSHLSKDNNCPKLVENLFSSQCPEVKVVVASRYEETEVFCIGAGATSSYRIPDKEVFQYTLF